MTKLITTSESWQLPKRSGALVRNTAFNLMGQAVPMLVAVFSIPLIIRGLGTEKFGLLTLAWMVIGYFGLFDIGIGRALTKLVAEKLGKKEDKEIPGLVWTGLILMGIFGAVGMAILYAISAYLITDLLKVPEALQRETLESLYLLALSVPIVITTAGLRGILEAYQRFDMTSTVRLCMGILTYLCPLVTLLFSSSLVAIVLILLVVRLIAWSIHVALCCYINPDFYRSIGFNKYLIKPLLSFGGWMTVSNVISPIMVYMDRFYIGTLVSISAVAYYATPYEIVTKLLIIPAALSGVLFPMFSRTFAVDPKSAGKYFSSGCKFTFLILFPCVVLILAFGYTGLDWWLGREFAENSTLVLQLLSIGIFINALAQIPFAFIQGIGRPDITAKLHIFELPIYLGILYLLTINYGIAGTASAWIIRVLIDGCLLMFFSLKYLTLPSNIKEAFQLWHFLV